MKRKEKKISFLEIVQNLGAFLGSASKEEVKAANG